MTNDVENMYAFIEHMKALDWVSGKNEYELQKGEWIVVFDTSSWIEVGTVNTPRIFDVPVPDVRLITWTENLICHLCETSEALSRS